MIDDEVTPISYYRISRRKHTRSPFPPLKGGEHEFFDTWEVLETYEFDRDDFQQARGKAWSRYKELAGGGGWNPEARNIRLELVRTSVEDLDPY